MYPRLKRVRRGDQVHEYVQLVEGRREAGKVRQRVVATLGRLDELKASGQLDRWAGAFTRLDPPAAGVHREVGPLLVVAHYLRRLGLVGLVDAAAPMRGRAQATHGEVIAALVANRLSGPAPLYDVAGRAAQRRPAGPGAGRARSGRRRRPGPHAAGHLGALRGGSEPTAPGPDRGALRRRLPRLRAGCQGLGGGPHRGPAGAGAVRHHRAGGDPVCPAAEGQPGRAGRDRGRAGSPAAAVPAGAGDGHRLRRREPEDPRRDRPPEAALRGAAARRQRLGGPSYTTAADVEKRVARVVGPKIEPMRVVTVGKARASKSKPSKPTLAWRRNPAAIAAAAGLDGLYALATNLPDRPDRPLTAQDVLDTYKDQWIAEQRNRDAKRPTQLRVRPIFLHTDQRIQALFGVIGIALLIFGLIEADLCRALPADDPRLPGLLPEGRTAKPTARNILVAFEHLALTHTANGPVLDRLTPTQRQILALLDIPLPWPERPEQ